MSGDTGMTAFITALNTGLSSTAMWGAIAEAAPLIITLVLFALGFRVVKKLVGNAPKGKAKIG